MTKKMSAEEKEARKNARIQNTVPTPKNENKLGIPILGYQLLWSIPKVEIESDDMMARVDKAFGVNFRPEAPSMPKIVRNTLESMNSKGVITRITNDDNADAVAYTLHLKQVDKVALDANMIREERIIYHKSTDKWEIDNPRNRKVISDLIAKYSNVYTRDDIVGLTIRYLDSVGAITMTRKGGLYFTTDSKVRDAVKTFLSSNGGRLYDLKVYDEDADKATMHEIVKIELDNDLQKASEELKQYLAECQESGPRIDALENRIEKFKEIRAKAELYRDLLASDIEELTKQVEVVSDEVRSALSGELKAYPQAAEFPLHAAVTYHGKAKEKYGTEGTVEGYFTDKNECLCVRVMFSKIGRVIAVPKSGLKLATASAAVSA